MNKVTKTELSLTLLILAVLVVSAYFMANVEMPPWAGYVSGINVVLFAIP
ncbi:MAG: hypothetical protein H0X08_02390, partial [Blastocatellia bacterium]|nr:hypothetical protein [Blastocatellia bacterium]